MYVGVDAVEEEEEKVRYCTENYPLYIVLRRYVEMTPLGPDQRTAEGTWRQKAANQLPDSGGESSLLRMVIELFREWRQGLSEERRMHVLGGR